MLGIFGLKSSWLQLTVQFVKSENKPSGFVWQSKFTFLNTCLNRIELDRTRLTCTPIWALMEHMILIPSNIISSGIIHPKRIYQYFTVGYEYVSSKIRSVFTDIQLSYSIKNMLVKGSMYELNWTLYNIWVTVFFRQLKICSYDGLSVTDGGYINVRWNSTICVRFLAIHFNSEIEGITVNKFKR